MKVLNFVFGVGIAVIIFIVALLGIQAFYPEPKYDKFCNTSIYSVPAQPVYTVYDCPGNINVTDCIKIINDKDINSPQRKAQDAQMQKCSTDYDAASKNYNKTFFLIASILGLLIIIIAFFLLNIINISAGTASAGIVLVAVAFARGWSTTNDTLKFIIGLVIAAVIVFLTIKINHRFSDDKDLGEAPRKKAKRR
jgi:hypothetical protein